MGNVEVLKRGDQLTSAGTGISHSEKAHGDKQVHFLQIWSLPSISRLTPTYFTRDDEKKDKWVRVVAPAGAPGVSSKREDSGPTPVQSGPLTLYSTILSIHSPAYFPYWYKQGTHPRHPDIRILPETGQWRLCKDLWWRWRGACSEERTWCLYLCHDREGTQGRECGRS